MGKIENPKIIIDISHSPQLIRSRRDLYEALKEDGNRKVIQGSVDFILDELGFIDGSVVVADTAYEATKAMNDSSK